MARPADREGTKKIVNELNQLVTPRNPSIEKSFEKLWPDLEALLGTARGAAGAVTVKPSETEMLTEVFGWVRAQKRRELSERNTSDYWPELLRSPDERVRGAAQVILENAAYDLLKRVKVAGLQSVTAITDGQLRANAVPGRVDEGDSNE